MSDRGSCDEQDKRIAALIVKGKAAIDAERARRRQTFDSDINAWQQACSEWRAIREAGRCSTEELKRVSMNLSRKKGFWGKFRRITHLMGWVFHEGRCVYCQADLVYGDYISCGLASTDHLVPKSRRSESFDPDGNWENLVPACSRCNGLKRHQDPSSEEGPTKIPS